MTTKSQKKVKAWAVYTVKATHGIVWARNGTFHMPLAVYIDKREAQTYAKDCNEGRKIYRVIPVEITYTIPAPSKRKKM